MAPTRPLGNAPVATDWGQAVHDACFTPLGCVASSVAVTVTGTTPVKLPLTVGGPNLSTGDYLVPAGGAGVYRAAARAVVTTLGALVDVRLHIYKNGVTLVGVGGYQAAKYLSSVADADALLTLAVGDRIALYYNAPSGATVTGAMQGYLDMLRIAESLT